MVLNFQERNQNEDSPNNCFNLTICPVMIPAGILPQESRQDRLQVKQMLGRLASLAKKVDDKVCATNACMIPYYLVAIKIR